MRHAYGALLDEIVAKAHNVSNSCFLKIRQFTFLLKEEGDLSNSTKMFS